MVERIPRILDDVASRMKSGRVTVIHGPRRVGKTNLVDHYLATVSGRALSVVGDDIVVRNILAGQNRREILAWAEGYDIVFIDEAQRISDVGWALKMLIDARPELTVIATGSASFQLAGSVGEPLTGRQTPLTLHPISVGELRQSMNDHELRNALGDLLVYGFYPEVRTASSVAEKAAILRELSASYLLKDILELERVKSSKALLDLLVLLALQTGNLVSLTELASQVGLDVKTVSRYLDLFEKAFILVNLRGFSRNLRSEITRTSKWYFYDVGVRNALINNLNPLPLREDVGALWENFLVMEAVKSAAYAGVTANLRFWRTWEQQEIDLIDERDGVLHAYEFKWNPNAKVKRPVRFLETYPNSTFQVVTPENFILFAMGSMGDGKL